MGSKYAGLRGRVPEQQTERDIELQVRLEEWEGQTLAELTASFNQFTQHLQAATEKVKGINLSLEACEILIREKLDALEGDAITVNGYTWSPKFEPYPVCEDPAAIIKYFEEHNMKDQLLLKSSELASRLKNFVKEEALNGELIVETKTVPDPETGEERTINDVRSQIPGVKVFLKGSLSRVKSKGAK